LLVDVDQDLKDAIKFLYRFLWGDFMKHRSALHYRKASKNVLFRSNYLFLLSLCGCFAEFAVFMVLSC